jgi:PAS domain S-box-containing protein
MWHGEFTVQRRDGTTFTALVTDSPIFDEEGTLIGIIGISTDITAEKAAQQALRESEERYRSLVELSPVPIGIYQGDQVIFVNEAVAHLLAANATEEIVGHSFYEFVHPESLPTVTDRLATLADGKVTPIAELKVLGLDGQIIEVESVAIPIVYQGKPAVQFVAHDVTRQKQAEAESARQLANERAQQRRFRALAGRLAEVEETTRQRLARDLHDRVGPNLTALNLNLNVVRNLLPLTEMDPRIEARLEDSFRLTEQTVEQIRNIMAELRPAVLDDYGLLAGLRWLAQQFAERTELETTVQGEVALQRLPADVETACYRIAEEALNNIAKHAQATEVTLRLEVTANTVRLLITDNGCGFDLDGTRYRRREVAGGWGLTIMRERAEALGGHFQVETAVGHGTKVAVEVAISKTS